ncbi:T-complex protein 1 subunit zeta [Microdochium nivale]|nr:T-complex protein 1 subunit zeta [Microdochium nivale]
MGKTAMAPPKQYDSDSSEGEDDVEYTETNVLLGYASKDPGDDSISRLGGRPDWLEADKAPSAALARCKICKDHMALLLQLNAELPTHFPGHERRLYVFSCRRKSCRRRDGSTSVIRGLRVEPGARAVGTAADKKEDKKSKSAAAEQKSPAPKPPSNLGETLFGSKGLGTSSGNANPFATGSSSAGTGSSNPFASPSSNPFAIPTTATKNSTPETKLEEVKEDTKANIDEEAKSLPKSFAETLSLNNPQNTALNPTAAPPPEPWPIEAEQAAPYPVSYLSEADYETLDPTPQTIPQATRMEVDDPAADGNGSGGKEDKVIFESAMDFDFQKFADRLAQNPEQSIRYEFAGQPLLYSKTDTVGQAITAASGTANRGMPRCGNCGAPRTFEVQLCPHAITELESDEMSLDGMDWGTVIVGVCERDCQARGVQEGEAGYLQEWVGVQWEEMTAPRR